MSGPTDETVRFSVGPPNPGLIGATVPSASPAKPGDLRAGLLMIALLAVDVAAFLLHKVASKGEADENVVHFFVMLVQTPALWAAVGLMPVQLWLWTRILARADIGWAYPLTSLAYPLTMILAALVLAERYDWHVWVGAVLISAGAAVIGPPQKSDTLERNEGSRSRLGAP